MPATLSRAKRAESKRTSPAVVARWGDSISQINNISSFSVGIRARGRPPPPPTARVLSSPSAREGPKEDDGAGCTVHGREQVLRLLPGVRELLEPAVGNDDGGTSRGWKLGVQAASCAPARLVAPLAPGAGAAVPRVLPSPAGARPLLTSAPPAPSPPPPFSVSPGADRTVSRVARCFARQLAILSDVSLTIIEIYAISKADLDTGSPSWDERVAVAIAIVSTLILGLWGALVRVEAIEEDGKKKDFGKSFMLFAKSFGVGLLDFIASHAFDSIVEAREEDNFDAIAKTAVAGFFFLSVACVIMAYAFARAEFLGPEIMLRGLGVLAVAVILLCVGGIDDGKLEYDGIEGVDRTAADAIFWLATVDLLVSFLKGVAKGFASFFKLYTK